MPKTTGTVVVRVACAVPICNSHLVWEDKLWRKGELSTEGIRLLQLNGWRKDHGEWVCWLHDTGKD